MSCIAQLSQSAFSRHANSGSAKEKLTDAATYLGNGASDAAETLQTHVEDTWDSVQHQTDRALRHSSVYLHKNPVPTALAALAFGLILGTVLSRRAPVSLKDRLIAMPLLHSRGILLGLLIAAGSLLRRIFSNAFRTGEANAEKIGAGLADSINPLRNTARQVGRKLAW